MIEKEWKKHGKTFINIQYEAKIIGRKINEMFDISTSAVLAHAPQKCTWTLIQIKNI